MKNFFYSFYGKLSVVFLLLLLILGGAQLIITYESSMRLISAADQQLNLNLADHIAGQLQPFLKEQATDRDLKANLHYLMVFNPRIEIYVLNDQGTIVNYFADPHVVKAERVPLQPIRTFLNDKPQGLILGNDPRHPGTQKPFSVARVELSGGRPGYLYIILSSERYNSTLNMVQSSYIISTSLKVIGIILALTAIAGLILFGFLTRRLRSITDKVEAFEKGDYTVRLDDDSRDEVGQLAGSFNRMAGTIQSNVKELKKNDELRRNLIANVSHDLRSPLASMQGYLETILIKKESINEQQRHKYLQVILDNTQMLRQLVQELFELSKLDAEQVKPRKEPFAIGELLQDVILKLKPQAENKEVRISANLSQNLPRVWADIGLIERVITNLLENAIRYTGSSVKIKLNRHGNHLVVAVKDNGPGIPEEDLPHVFDRFHRGDKSRSLSDGNSGLGLAITQKILELHESEIGVESEEGVGTTFRFKLPIYKRSRPQA